jgi:hypothetical protein
MVMSGGLKTKLRGSQNRIDMLFPKLARFRMSLESMKDREHMRPVDSFVEAGFIPFSICIVNGYIGGIIRRRVVHISISSISTIDWVSQMSQESNKEALNQLLNT